MFSLQILFCQNKCHSVIITDIEHQIKEMEQNIKDMDDVEFSIIPFGSNEVASDDIQENESIQMCDLAWSVAVFHVSRYTVHNASVLGC